MLFITIGLGFIFINLNINDIQIVPSFVGYLLIALGSSQLKRESVYFRRILPAAIVMTVINVWSYLMSLMTASEWSGVVSDLYQTIFWVILLLILSAILQLFITYCLAKGVLEMEKTHRCDLGGHRLVQLWQGGAVLVVPCNLLALLGEPGLSAIAGLNAVAGAVGEVVHQGFFFRW